MQKQAPGPDGNGQDIIKTALQALTAKTRAGDAFLPLGAYPLPHPEAAQEITSLARQILFFGYIGRQDLTLETLDAHLAGLAGRLHAVLSEQIARSLRHTCRRQHGTCDQCRSRGDKEAGTLIAKLPTIRDMLEEDIKAAFAGDPAAKNDDEIVFSYPGILAISVHRVAHELYLQGVPLLPRLISELAHSATGIDIHPGAKIGHSFFIDHGTGVVIGETTVIGDHVKMYQGVTLGALSFPRDACGALIRGMKRHPTIEDNVTIYSGATVLGGDTVVGNGSVIGGNVWLTHSVPPGTKVLMETPRLRFHNSEKLVKDKYVTDFQI